ncbi:MAG: lipopolysaccharide heptosyltransferase II [Chthoniobacterales bacterium]
MKHGAGKITLRRRPHRMLDYCTYLLYRAGLAVVTLLPLPLLFRAGELGGLLVWMLSRKYRRLAQHNLRIAFGAEKSAVALRRLTRQHFQRLGANLLSSAKLGTMPIAEIAARVSLENEHLAHEALRAGRGAILVLSHLGNWELCATLLPHFFDDRPLATVFQPLGNRYIDACIRKSRTRSGLRLFDRRAGFQEPIEFLRAGNAIGILADQHAGDHGLWTPFFGRLASTTPLPALLARRTSATLLTAAIQTSGIGRWRMIFFEKLDTRAQSIASLTFQLNEIIADQIRRAPEDWFWVHNRWKTPRPNFLLTKYKRGIYLPADVMPQPFRILIRSTNWLGDSVLSAAAVRAIKHGRPDAHITIAAPEKIASVWKLVPEVDEILPLTSRSLFAAARLFKKQTPFDVAVLFPNSLRAALEVWLAGVPRRVGYRGHSRAWLLNQIVPPVDERGPIQHQVNHYLHLARSLGAEITFAPEVASRNGPSSGSKIALCAGAEYGPAKRWLPERFAEVATAVAAQKPAVQWHLFGTSADTEIGKQIAEPLGDRCVNRIGQTTLDELIAELCDCRLLLTNDTGTMHLATLLGVPVIAIFGSTEDRLTGPLGPENVVIRHHVECSPCFLRECPIDFRCMKAVTVEEVTAAVLARLAS